MEFNLEQIIIVTVLAFITGAFLSYLIVKSIRVSRHLYDVLKENLGATQNELDTQKALVQQFSIDKNLLESKFAQEHELNLSLIHI